MSAARSRRRTPDLEWLENRALRTTATQQNLAYSLGLAWHRFHQYQSELQSIEFRSEATPAEALALRDAARSISQAATGTTLPLPVAQQKAITATLQLDQAPLDGWLGPQDWALVQSRLTTDLDGLDVPTPLIDQTVAAMQDVARSAGVTAHDYQNLKTREDAYRVARNSIPNSARSSYPSNYGPGGNFGSSADLPDPQIYYTEHLRGFFRGIGAQVRSDRSRLASEIRAIAPGDPAAQGVLRTNAGLLEQIRSTLTSAEDSALTAVFDAAFQGSPNPTALDQGLRGILGGPASVATIGKADRLASAASAFFQAAGSSRENVRALAQDVLALNNDGAGASLNPFKVQIGRI